MRESESGVVVGEFTEVRCALVNWHSEWFCSSLEKRRGNIYFKLKTQHLIQTFFTIYFLNPIVWTLTTLKWYECYFFFESSLWKRFFSHLLGFIQIPNGDLLMHGEVTGTLEFCVFMGLDWIFTRLVWEQLQPCDQWRIWDTFYLMSQGV